MTPTIASNPRDSIAVSNASYVIEQIPISILTKIHALLVGVPGLAKTLVISTLADTIHLTFQRIPFTPDLMPDDITHHLSHPPKRVGLV